MNHFTYTDDDGVRLDVSQHEDGMITVSVGEITDLSDVVFVPLAELMLGLGYYQTTGGDFSPSTSVPALGSGRPVEPTVFADPEEFAGVYDSLGLYGDGKA